jgi:hypothetical protein
MPSIGGAENAACFSYSHTLREAQILIERWRRDYNAFRPHSSLGYQPPAPEAVEVGPPIGRIFTPDTELALT